MRILHVTDHYLPALGGIEMHVSALADRQAREGHDVTVLTSTPAWSDGRGVDDAPVSVRRSSIPAGLRTDFARYDVVHAHISVLAPFTAPMASVAADSGAATVVTVHSLWNGLGPVPGLAARVSGLRAAPVTWTAVSEVAARELRKRLPLETPVRLLPNAVDAPARAASPEPREPVRLVSTMRIAGRKRPLALLRIYDEVRRTASVATRLIIVGDGPLRQRLERQVRRDRLEDLVTVTGRLTPADVLLELARSDVYIAPALLESFGLAALEARFVGLPVVAHADTGVREFVDHGLEGLLCVGDADMVGSLARLVDDADLRLRIAEHNRRTPSPMTWARTLARHDAVYDMARTSRGQLASPSAHVGSW